MTERELCGHPCGDYLEEGICNCTMFGGRRDNVRSASPPVEVRIPAAGDPFAAREAPPMDRLGFRCIERPRPSTEEPAGPTSEDYAAARRTFRAEMNTGPDPYADPARWIGCSDSDEDERRGE